MSIEDLRKVLAVGLAIVGCVVCLSLAGAGYLRWKSVHSPPQNDATVAAGSPRESLQAAETLLRERKAEQAIVAFRQILAAHPDSVEAQLGIAQGEYLAGREEDAAREYERVLEMESQQPAALLELALIYSHRRETWPRSENRYREYLKLRPGDAQAQLGLARVFAWQGRAEEAAEIFARSEVLKLMTPADERHHAFALMKLKRMDEAEPILRKVLAREPADRESIEQLAAVYASRRQWDMALPLYRRLLESSPNHPRLNLTYGQGLLAQRRYKEALGPLGKAVGMMPANGEAALAYARAWKGAGDLKRASKEFERALPRLRTDAQLVREYADLMLERKKYGEAARYYREAERLGLRDERLQVSMGGALIGSRKYKEAVPYLEYAYRHSPTPRRAMDLAKAYSKAGRKEEARLLLAEVERMVVRTARQ
jgi:tetratricopeptide (TPR) repeat protein